MRFGKSYAAFYCFQQRKMHRLLCTVTALVYAVCYDVFYHNGQGGRTMTKDFLLRLTEEHYGVGAFPIYGRLLEEQWLTRGGPLLPLW